MVGKMNVMGLGLDFTGRRLFDLIDEQEFSDRIIRSFPHETLEVLSRDGASGYTFRQEVERERHPDLGDPHVAGWTFLVNGDDPSVNDIIRTIHPLAEHRKMSDPTSPLVFNNEAEEDWRWWIGENYRSPDVEEIPHYILIVAGPAFVPFRFQAFLDIVASVGRVYFDSMNDLDAYVKKIIRLEKADAPVVDRTVLFFAPDGGPDDPTFFSRLHMAEPLSEYTRTDLGLNTQDIVRDEATKQRLSNACNASNPALVYTASHGVGAQNESLDIQKRYNGAICCQGFDVNPGMMNLFSADDISYDAPFLEGSVFFQFACFGYGTPAYSDFMHWFGQPELNSEEDFIAALPKKLLAHPRGPIGYIGHVDATWLHGFADPENPLIIDRWHKRIFPFKKAIDELLACQPLGRALSTMNEEYNFGNSYLSSLWDRIQRGGHEMTLERNSRLVNTFIKRSDAQNYMIFGDPAARLRIPLH